MTSNTLLTTYDCAGETVTNTNPNDSFATPNPSQKHSRSYDSRIFMRRIKPSPNGPSRSRDVESEGEISDVESVDAFTTPNRPTKPSTLNAPPRQPRSRDVERVNGFTTPTRLTKPSTLNTPPLQLYSRNVESVACDVESDGDGCDVESESDACDVEENVEMCTTPKHLPNPSIPNAPRKLGGRVPLTRQNAMVTDDVEENVEMCTTPKHLPNPSIPNAPRKLGGRVPLTRQNAMVTDDVESVNYPQTIFETFTIPAHLVSEIGDDDPFPGGHPVLMRQNATLH
jgi:hypothetical protein